MKNLKYLQRFFILLFVGFVLCTVQACGDDEEDEPIQEPDEEAVKPDDGKEEDEPSDKLTDTMEAVDLGLPSGLKWATCNVGASKPEEYGDYFAWGETEEKNNYEKNSYKFYNKATDEYENIGSNISGTQYDIAHVKWGGNWRMPTESEIQELVNNCTWKWTLYNGVNGQLVTGPNGNSIFLPAAGALDGTDLGYAGSDGFYWSASPYNSSDFAGSLSFYSDNYGWYIDFRFSGLSVRPVTGGIANSDDENEEKEPNQEPDKEEEPNNKQTINGHEYVDLGLSVKWATCNVGASSSEGSGNYYAWGETTTKSNYNSSNSTTYGLSYSELQSRGIIDSDGNLTTSYDAATANWGGSWRMPTMDEIKELRNNCTWKWTTYNGVNGRLVTAPNGNSIFLPAVGRRYGTDRDLADYSGHYWSATTPNSDSNNAYYLFFASDDVYSSLGFLRYYGHTVRPVTDELLSDSEK